MSKWVLLRHAFGNPFTTLPATLFESCCSLFQASPLPYGIGIGFSFNRFRLEPRRHAHSSFFLVNRTMSRCCSSASRSQKTLGSQDPNFHRSQLVTHCLNAVRVSIPLIVLVMILVYLILCQLCTFSNRDCPHQTDTMRIIAFDTNLLFSGQVASVSCIPPS